MDIHRYRNSRSLNHEQTAAVKVKKSDDPIGGLTWREGISGQFENFLGK